tara:strand:- start:1280 stop:1507 length:228 start_codon:yes stop_codon:yes gene_type:complete
MDEEDLIWARFYTYDQVRMKDESPKTAKQVVKEYYPSISDEELDIIIQREMKNIEQFGLESHENHPFDQPDDYDE